MFLPIRTDRQLRRTPWVNYGVIAINVFIWLAFLNTRGGPGGGAYMLHPGSPRLFQFISYQFLHANFQHLAGNMFFLYVFGNSVEDRLGKVAYLLFYLAGGVLAGLGHALMEDAPVLGASGAVAAVSGAYLVLFPLSNVTIFYWLVFFIGTFEVSGMLLILFQIAQDAVMYLSHFGGVAYLAHLSGYAFGFVIGMVLLRTGMLAREPYDLPSLLEQRRRRAQFRALTRKGYQPWEHQQPPGDEPASPPSPHQRQIMQIRAQVASALNDHQLDLAAHLYGQLLDQDPQQVMSQQQQLDLANHLMHQRRHETAAHAYELFLQAFKAYPQREQIELILGLIYGRYLHRPQRAHELLTAALPRLRNEDEKQLAHQVLGEVSTSPR